MDNSMETDLPHDSSLTQIPVEIWGIIFSHLPKEYNRSSALCSISKCFRSFWWSTRNKLVIKSTVSGEEADAIARLLNHFQDIKSLDLSNLNESWTSKQLFTVATANPKLDSIKFPQKDLGKREIKSILSHYTKPPFAISSIDTTVYGQIYEDDFNLLARLKNLKELVLWELQDSGILQITERPSIIPQTLQRLTVTFCWLTPVGYEKIRLFTNLEELSLKTLKHRPLQPKNFAWLEPLKKLRSLCVDFHKITPKKLQRISQIPTLTSLNLSQNVLSPSVSSLQALNLLRNLTVLRLSRFDGVENCFSTRDRIPAVFSQLEEIDLSWCFELTDEHISNLGEQTKQYADKHPGLSLRRLTLAGCIKLTDAAVGHIVNFFGFLEHLSLSDCNQITDQAFTALDVGAFQYLKSLDVSFCEKLTENTASRLEKLPNVQSLRAVGMSKKFRQVIERWPEALPAVAIEYS